MSELQLDPNLVATLAALETHRVEFVLVGDVAHAIYDHGGIVCAVAIVPGAYARNVERLAHTLHTLSAELGIAGRPDPCGLDWRRMDLRELAPCTFMTAYADIDVDFQPIGTNGYRDLFQDADRFAVAPGVRPYVASLDDLDRVGRDVRRPRAPEAPAPYVPEPYAREPYAPAPYAPTTPMAPPVAPPRFAEGIEATQRPAPVQPPDDDYDPGIWTEEEFRAIRAGRTVY